MFREDVSNVTKIAEKKVKYLNENGTLKYTVLSMMGGFFVAIGSLFSYTVGGYLDGAHNPSAKIAMGMAFSIALCLVIFAGAELFTSNNMAMAIGYLDKKVTLINGIRIWIFCWLGNLLGSLLAAVMYVYSGAAAPEVQKLILKISESKMNTPVDQLFIKAIFCNILVCLGVWCAYKMKTESGKFLMIFLCVFAFFTAGFEHSVANMGLLAMALLFPHGAGITLGGYAYNLGIATLGNIIGGALFIGAVYYFVSPEYKKDK
ncbi:MAG: formate/nitrite transporter family protein [Clostridium sp.]